MLLARNLMGYSVQDHPANPGSVLHLFTSTQVLSGYVHCQKEIRLLDLLNGELPLGATRERAFLELSPGPQGNCVLAPQVSKA